MVVAVKPQGKLNINNKYSKWKEEMRSLKLFKWIIINLLPFFTANRDFWGRLLDF